MIIYENEYFLNVVDFHAMVSHILRPSTYHNGHHPQIYRP